MTPLTRFQTGHKILLKERLRRLKLHRLYPLGQTWLPHAEQTTHNGRAVHQRVKQDSDKRNGDTGNRTQAGTVLQIDIPQRNVIPLDLWYYEQCGLASSWMWTHHITDFGTERVFDRVGHRWLGGRG